jgi:DMSO/TMAO reductase YedYZ molybdopterin-dependent catalytic subunit
MSSTDSLDQLARNGLAPPSQPELVPRQTAPDNAEFPLHDWWSWITPNRLFYVRSHFPVPRLDPTTWRLVIDGEVEQPVTLSLADLQEMPRRRRVVTLVCAGNRRTEFEPKPPGVPWRDGAISTAEWEGVALTDLLARARPRAAAREVLLEGADRGTVAGVEAPISFARSLSLERALRPDILLADGMNAAPLAPDHGAPLRAVVPGAYGMDSVKWLVRIQLLDHEFGGHFQVNDYRHIPDPATSEPSRPLGSVRVNSLIASPRHGAELKLGETARVVGYAWSGRGMVREVQLSLDDGSSWEPARRVGPEEPDAWRLWEAEWRPVTPGTYRLAVRAVDSSGETQPDRAEWNVKGYGNNALHRIEVIVR